MCSMGIFFIKTMYKHTNYGTYCLQLVKNRMGFIRNIGLEKFQIIIIWTDGDFLVQNYRRKEETLPPSTWASIALLKLFSNQVLRCDNDNLKWFFRFLFKTRKCHQCWSSSHFLIVFLVQLETSVPIWPHKQ